MILHDLVDIPAQAYRIFGCPGNHRTTLYQRFEDRCELLRFNDCLNMFALDSAADSFRNIGLPFILIDNTKNNAVENIDYSKQIRHDILAFRQIRIKP
jgi:hypothetical protein